jgi:uncharacterized protein (DUF302 family)
MQTLKKWFAILAFAALGMAALAPAQAAAPSPRDMFIESQSPLNFADTIAAIKAEVGSMGWSVLVAHDMSAILAKKGHTIAPLVILELCSGKYSVALVKKDETRYVSSLIPCRLSVYETSDGKVIISRMNTTVMGAMMEPAVADVMKKAGADLETIIAKISAKK